MTTQSDLFAAPPLPASIRWFEELLRNAGGWMTATEIAIATNGRINERQIREFASASEWIISGQKGYKHIEHGTAEEIDHAAAWLESQAKKMGERAGKIRRNGHRRIG